MKKKQKSLVLKNEVKEPNKFENAKEMNMFKFLRKAVDIGANGTQKYMVKQGKNKGKIL